jgi:hypothetical protein
MQGSVAHNRTFSGEPAIPLRGEVVTNPEPQTPIAFRVGYRSPITLNLSELGRPFLHPTTRAFSPQAGQAPARPHLQSPSPH